MAYNMAVICLLYCSWVSVISNNPMIDPRRFSLQPGNLAILRVFNHNAEGQFLLLPGIERGSPGDPAVGPRLIRFDGRLVQGDLDLLVTGQRQLVTQRERQWRLAEISKFNAITVADTVLAEYPGFLVLFQLFAFDRNLVVRTKEQVELLSGGDFLQLRAAGVSVAGKSVDFARQERVSGLIDYLGLEKHIRREFGDRHVFDADRQLFDRDYTAVLCAVGRDVKRTGDVKGDRGLLGADLGGLERRRRLFGNCLFGLNGFKVHPAAVALGLLPFAHRSWSGSIRHLRLRTEKRYAPGEQFRGGAAGG